MVFVHYKRAIWGTQDNVSLSRKYLQRTDSPLFLHTSEHIPPIPADICIYSTVQFPLTLSPICTGLRLQYLYCYRRVWLLSRAHTENLKKHTRKHVPCLLEPAAQSSVKALCIVLWLGNVAMYDRLKLQHGENHISNLTQFTQTSVIWKYQVYYMC